MSESVIIDNTSLFAEGDENVGEFVERTTAKTPGAVQTVVNVCENIAEERRCNNHSDICSWDNNKCNANSGYQNRLEGYKNLLLQGKRVKTIKDNIDEIDNIVDKIKNDDQMDNKKDIEKMSDVYPYSSINISCLFGFLKPLQLTCILLLISVSVALSYIKNVFNLNSYSLENDIAQSILQTKVFDNFKNENITDNIKYASDLIDNQTQEVIKKIEDTYNIASGDLNETITAFSSNRDVNSSETELIRKFDEKSSELAFTYKELKDAINDIDTSVNMNIDENTIDSPLYLDSINSTRLNTEQIETSELSESNEITPVELPQGSLEETNLSESDITGLETSVDDTVFDNVVFNKTGNIINTIASFLAIGISTITSVSPFFVVGLVAASITIIMFKNYTNSKLRLMQIMGFSNINVYQHLVTLLKICIKLNIDATYIVNDILFEDSEEITTINRTINKACILLRERITSEWNRRIDLALTKYLVSDKRGFYYDTIFIKSTEFVEAKSDDSINQLNEDNLKEYMKMLGIDYVEDTDNSENSENSKNVKEINTKQDELKKIYSENSLYIGAYVTLSIKDIDYDIEKVGLNNVPDIDNPAIFLNNQELKDILENKAPLNVQLDGQKVNYMISKEKYRKLELINSLNKQYRIFHPNENRLINNTTLDTNDIHFFNFYCLQEVLFNLPKPLKNDTVDVTVDESVQEAVKGYLEYPFNHLTPDKTINQTYRDFIKFLKTYVELKNLTKDTLGNEEKIRIIKEFISSGNFTGIGYLRNAGSSILTYSKKLLRLVGEITVVAVAIPTIISGATGAAAGITVGATAKSVASLAKTATYSLATQTLPDIRPLNKKVTSSKKPSFTVRINICIF